MKKRKLKLIILLSISCFIAILYCSNKFHSTQDSLLARSQRIASLPPSFRDYTWLSKDELLFLKVDIRLPNYTLTRKRLSGEEQYLNTGFPINMRLLDGFSQEKGLSPDNKWLRWNCYQTCICSNIETGSFYTFSCKAKDSLDTCWIPDSQQWVEFIRNKAKTQYIEMLIRNANSSKVIQYLPIDANSPINDEKEVERWGAPRLLSKEKAISILFTSNHVDIVLMNPSERMKLVKKFQFNLPKEVKQILEIVPLSDSSIEEKYAYLVLLNDSPNILAQFCDRFHLIKRQPQSIYAIWIGKIDGTNMREIGRIALSYSEPEVWRLEWKKNSNRVSFICNNAIWTTPFD